MARGNDSAAAEEELTARTGMAPNAEQMIAENVARWPAELRAANNRAVDQDATDELSDDDVAGMVDGEVLGYAVRGPFVVVVSEDEDGNIVKEAVPRKGQEKQAEKLAPEAKSPEEADKEAQKEAKEEAKAAKAAS